MRSNSRFGSMYLKIQKINFIHAAFFWLIRGTTACTGEKDDSSMHTPYAILDPFSILLYLLLILGSVILWSISPGTPFACPLGFS